MSLFRKLFGHREKPAQTIPMRVVADRREDALRAGGGILLEASNVAPGTLGYALCALEMDGLATVRYEVRRIDPITWQHVWTYELTETGRRAQAMLAD